MNLIMTKGMDMQLQVPYMVLDTYSILISWFRCFFLNMIFISKINKIIKQ